MLCMHEAIHYHRDGTVTVRRWFSSAKGKPPAGRGGTITECEGRLSVSGKVDNKCDEEVEGCTFTKTGNRGL